MLLSPTAPGVNVSIYDKDDNLYKDYPGPVTEVPDWFLASA